MTNFDLTYLNSLFKGSQDAIDQTILLFLRTTPELIAEIRKNVDESDWDNLKINTHKAKSSFRLIGSQVLADELEFMELNSFESAQNELKNKLTNVEGRADTIFDELLNHSQNTDDHGK